MKYFNPKDICQKLITAGILDIVPGFIESDTEAIGLKNNIDRAAADGNVQAVKDGLFALRTIAGNAEFEERKRNLKVNAFVDELLDSPLNDLVSDQIFTLPSVDEDYWTVDGKFGGKASSKITTSKPGIPLLKEGTPDYIKSLKTAPAGIFIGLKDFDDRFGRVLEPGHFDILAGRPGSGKTALGLQIGEYHAISGLNVLIWSMEMSMKQLIQRLISKHSGVSVKDLKNRTFNLDDYPKIVKAAEIVNNLRFYCNDLSCATNTQIYTDTQALHKKLFADTGKGLGLVIIDYIQLAKSDKQEAKRDLEVSAVCNALRCLAKDVNLPVLGLAQLNRDLEKRSDKRPQMSDLGESGALERDAHAVMFIYREAMYCPDCLAGNCVKVGHKHSAEIIMSKNRDGEFGTVPIFFNGARQIFESLSKEDQDYNERTVREEADRKAADDLSKAGAAKCKVKVPTTPKANNGRKPYTPSPKPDAFSLAFAMRDNGAGGLNAA